MRRLFKGKLLITQAFGNKFIVNNKDYYARFGLKGHNGIDIVPNDRDWLIFAGDSGKVIYRCDNPKDIYGLHIILLKDSIITIYAHMSAVYVDLNSIVTPMTMIGVMGATGGCYGAHLHIGRAVVDENNKRVNFNNGFRGWIDPTSWLMEDSI